jgi:hypothetical protein
LNTLAEAARQRLSRVIRCSVGASIGTVASFAFVSAGQAQVAPPPLGLGGGQEQVPSIQRPNTSRLPVFDRFIDAPQSFGGGFAGNDEVAVATGGGRVYISSETNGAVAMYDPATLAHLGNLSGAGLDKPRGVSYYGGEVFVVDGQDNQVLVFEPLTGAVKRYFALPPEFVLGGTSVVGSVKMTGVDVAWREAWVTFQGGLGGGGVVIFDIDTGAVRGVNWHLPNYDCQADPNELGLGDRISECGTNNLPSTPYYIDVIVHCQGPYLYMRPGEVGAGGGPSISPADLYECAQAATGSNAMYRLNWWDIATIPEHNRVIAQCRFINRNALATATSTDDISPLDPLVARNDCSAGLAQGGVDAVWGMQWLLTAPMDCCQGQGNYTIYEYAIDPPATLAASPTLTGPMRTWRPKTAGGSRDVSYQHREARVDWKGDLTKSEWQRGVRCADYMVTDADIFVVAERGERWLELARNLDHVELRVDGATKATSTEPMGRICFNADEVVSGMHEVELVAILTTGARPNVRNSAYRVDHDGPTTTLSGPGRFIARTVSLGGTATDAHSGAEDWGVDYAGADGVWRELCPSRDLSNATCSWDTTQVADGAYRLRARSRDRVTPTLGGPNIGYSGETVVIVDNTAPTLSASRDLWEAQDGRPLFEGAAPDLTVEGRDSGSGVVRSEVLVDGVSVNVRDQGCDGGGCALSHDYLFPAANYADGTHEVAVVVRDGAGNSSAVLRWSVIVELMVEGEAEISANASLPDPSTVNPLGTAATGRLLPCEDEGARIAFPHFSLGPAFEGMTATYSMRRCDLPYPQEPVRANFVSYIYGDCAVTVDEGDGRCVPPLEVQSWPACERTLADYPARLQREARVVRGAPAAAFAESASGLGTRLEVYTGNTTVVLFGHEPGQVARAANALVEELSQPPLLPSMLRPSTVQADPLAPAVPGAIEGQLQC